MVGAAYSDMTLKKDALHMMKVVKGSRKDLLEILTRKTPLLVKIGEIDIWTNFDLAKRATRASQSTIHGYSKSSMKQYIQFDVQDFLYAIKIDRNCCFSRF